MNEYLKQLDQDQKTAVTAGNGVVRVICGAGGGKTRVLTRRVIHLIEHEGIQAPNILCVTFTNKAAAEMKERIRTLLNTPTADAPVVSTFHSWGANFLRREGVRLGFPEVKIITPDDQEKVLQSIYSEYGFKVADFPYERILSWVASMKQDLYLGYDYAKILQRVQVPEIKMHAELASLILDKIGWLYLYRQKQERFIDLTDLLTMPNFLLKTNEDVRLRWSNQYHHILVDEAQDVCKIEFELLRNLMGAHHNLFMVGDPDQNIYTWRGADAGFLIDAEHFFPNISTIIMKNNYRSTASIVEASNQLIQHNQFRIKKESNPIRDYGMPMMIYHARNSDKEAEYIANEIDMRHKENVPYREIAVLTRTNGQHQSIENALRMHKIPYVINKNISFFDRTEIRVCLNYLRFIALLDDTSFRRIINVPKRNFGKSTMHWLSTYAEYYKLSLWEALRRLRNDKKIQKKAEPFLSLMNALRLHYEEKSIYQLLEDLLEKSGYASTLENHEPQRYANVLRLKDFIRATEREEQISLQDFLNNILLYEAPVTADEDMVQVETIHASKGLEYDTVFVFGMTDGTLPWTRALGCARTLEEERRLAYVALTRAKEQLHLTYSDYDVLRKTTLPPSRFLEELGESPHIRRITAVNMHSFIPK